MSKSWENPPKSPFSKGGYYTQTLFTDRLLGILATINWFVREFKKTNPQIEMITKLNIQEDQIPTTIKTVIYRIMQEALNNIIKHSRAKVVNLGLEIKEGKIEFIIQDDGQGFD